MQILPLRSLEKQPVEAKKAYPIMVAFIVTGIGA